MPLYEIVVERVMSATIYVEAVDDLAARDAADNLPDAADFDEDHSDVAITEIDAVPAGERYWTGGESGRWVEP